jgi:hypothetical protein
MDSQFKTIRIVGLVIIIISVLTSFFNLMGALAWSIMWSSNDITSTYSFEQKVSFIYLFIVTNALLYLIGGIYLRKMKMWANRFLFNIIISIYYSNVGIHYYIFYKLHC